MSGAAAREDDYGRRMITVMETESNIKIRVQNLSKIFGRNPSRAIEMIGQGMTKTEILNKTRLAVGVSDVSFDVYRGETLVIMGLSGSGKSTLVRCVNRLIEPTVGQIVVDGQDVTKLNDNDLREVRRRKYGMVFQSFALFPHRTVLENVEFGLEVQKVDSATRRKRAVEALAQVGLEGWGTSMPAQLSGGMKQRVGLARALAVDPDILLMDEAFSALDPLIRTEMQDELIDLESRVQKTILFITHDLDEALKMGNRIVLMRDGGVVQIGTPEDILANPADDYVARFLENVDITKVLTAGDIMRSPQHVAYVNDGPRTALHKMKEEGLSGLFVVRQDHRLVGYVSADAASAAVRQPGRRLDQVVDHRSVPLVQVETPIRRIFPVVAASTDPVAVVNDKNVLKGVIVRGAVLAALAERGELND